MKTENKVFVQKQSFCTKKNKNTQNKKVLQILTRVAQNLQKKNLMKSQEKIVCTISGGQDSICLLVIFFCCEHNYYYILI